MLQVNNCEKEANNGEYNNEQIEHNPIKNKLIIFKTLFVTIRI